MVKIFNFDLHVQHQRKEFFGTVTMNFGRVRVISQTTLEEQDLIFVVIQIGFYDFRCSVKPYVSEEEFDKLEKELFEALYQLPILDLSKRIDAHFGETYYALKDLRLGDRAKIISILTHETIAKVSNFYENIYEENLRMNEIYRSINVPIPVEFRYAAEHTLSKRMMEALHDWGQRGFPAKRMLSIYRIMDSAKALDVHIRKEPLAQHLSEELCKGLQEFIAKPDPETLQKLLSILRLAKKIDIFIDKRKAQDDLFGLFRSWKGSPQAIPQVIRDEEHHLHQLMDELDLSSEKLKKVLGAEA
jgi:hypothetical protein